jgi:hypothetical protein
VSAAARTLITSAFVPETSATASHYPQMSRDSTSNRFQAVYWRCLEVFFITARRTAPDAELKLFLPAPTAAGAFGPVFDALGVELVEVPFDHGPPPGFANSFRSCFYLLDIVQHLSATLADDDVVMLLDNDCVCARPLDAMVETARTEGVLAYHIPYSEDHDINGLTRRQEVEIYRDIGFPIEEPPAHYGGELFAATGRETRRIEVPLEHAWSESLRRFAAGQRHFPTEEHHLGFALNSLGYSSRSASAFIDRIWHERPAERRRAEETLQLAIWHTPAEKTLGFRSLFREARDRRSKLWQLPVGDELARHLGRHLGIPYRTRRKKVADVVAARLGRWPRLDPAADFVERLAAPGRTP